MVRRIALMLLVLSMSAGAWAASVRRAGSDWVLENAALRVNVSPSLGRIAVLDKRCGYEWRQSAAETTSPFTDVVGAKDGIRFTTLLGATKGIPNTCSLTLTLPGSEADLELSLDMADRESPIEWLPAPPPFLLDSPDGVLAVADYCNGHLYPLNLKPFPAEYFDGARLDMPWLGLCDLRKGMGCALILQTSDDANVVCRPHSTGDREVVAPQIGWLPSKGRFGYPRRMLFRFTSKGGYVALAKAYRSYAASEGLIVPFSKKLKTNPRISRLFGAPDVWGDASLRFARAAKAAGVQKMLIHGVADSKEMAEVNRLGYLTSAYDNYTDILQVEEGKDVSSDRDLVPEHVVLNADGSRMKAWLTWDGKLQYMKRCPFFWAGAAEKSVSKLLETYPYLGRFIDVTTAEGLYECYDPAHPLTRGEKRGCGVELLRTVRSHKLVVGGEHGIWWGVPYQDYIEGMMSGAHYSWPAGHLIHPKSKDEEFRDPWGNLTGRWADYEKWGIGHEWRAPLWELVFHDCVVSTWYWGDSTDWLLQAAPEVSAKKDAFNALYGTIPLLWADGGGSWANDREAFLRTYRNTCKLHEAVAGKEMTNHEFLTPDHAAQRTTFSDGTSVVANFGSAPYTMTLAGRTYILPQNGLVAKGPAIEESVQLVGGRTVTSIRRPGYAFSDADGVPVTVQATGACRIRVDVGSAGRRVSVNPGAVCAGWDLKSTLAYELDDLGTRTAQIAVSSGRTGLVLMKPSRPGAIELVCGAAARRPDLKVERVTTRGTVIVQGAKALVDVSVRNIGLSAARGAVVNLYADRASADRLLGRARLDIGAGAGKSVGMKIDTSRLDGNRRLIAVVSTSKGTADLCEGNNTASAPVSIRRDASLWRHSRFLVVRPDAALAAGHVVCSQIDAASLDPASLRVVECRPDGKPGTDAIAQVDRADGTDTLVVILPHSIPAGGSRRFRVLWAEKSSGARFLPMGAPVWRPDEQVVDAETYRLHIRDGALVEISPKRGGVVGSPVISQLLYSSQETGWGDEPGTVTSFETLATGPARTVIRVRKSLNSGVGYVKTYAFYPDRIDLTAEANCPYVPISRAYYLQPGDYADSGGHKARIDSVGDGEGVAGETKQPRWFCVYTPEWAHSCAAMSDFDSVTYWDSGLMGGLGFVTGQDSRGRMVYLFHDGAKDASFAEDDYRSLHARVTAGWDPSVPR